MYVIVDYFHKIKNKTWVEMYIPYWLVFHSGSFAKYSAQNFSLHNFQARLFPALQIFLHETTHITGNNNLACQKLVWCTARDTHIWNLDMSVKFAKSSPLVDIDTFVFSVNLLGQSSVSCCCVSIPKLSKFAVHSKTGMRQT